MEIKNEALSSLVKSFEELPDSRRKQGQRHDQSVVLMIVLFSTMSGYLGYRAMGDFVKKHKAELVELLKVKKTRLPSFSTIRRVLINLNTDGFEEVYRKWLKGLKSKLEVASQEVNSSAAQGDEIGLENWYSGDGKFVRGANQYRANSDQLNLVSIFSSFQKIVHQSEQVSSKSNEIPCVQKMIQETDLKGIILTLDPLHCQKKRLPILKHLEMIM